METIGDGSGRVSGRVVLRQRAELSAEQVEVQRFSYELGCLVRKYEGVLTPSGVSAVLFDLAVAKIKEVRGREYVGEKVN